MRWGAGLNFLLPLPHDIIILYLIKEQTFGIIYVKEKGD